MEKTEVKRKLNHEKKETRGITLIALVVTIIVLLILAGVSISMLASDNGILKRANEAKEETQRTTEDEQRKMATYEAAMNTKNTEYTDPKTNEQITIPAGFAPTRIEGESIVDEGIVIIDSEGNEFVWVPVPNVINNKEKTITDLTYTPMAEKIEGTENYRGISYKELNISNKSVQIEEYKADSGWREPSLIKEYDKDERFKTMVDFGVTTAEELKNQMQNDYNGMIESIVKYGGFFIARYEMSYDGNNVQYQKGKISFDSSKTTNKWYEYYKKQREFADNNIYGSIKSSMIWGSQYDAMLLWMVRNNIDVTDIKENQLNTDRTTGTNEKDKFMNIYDLAGNSKEWTLEAADSNARVVRGENFKILTGLGHRGNAIPTAGDGGFCSRATIYIND